MSNSMVYPSEVSIIMTEKLKTIAIFGCSFSSIFRQSLCPAFNTAAEEFNVNLVYIHSLGKIGNKNAQLSNTLTSTSLTELFLTVKAIMLTEWQKRSFRSSAELNVLSFR